MSGERDIIHEIPCESLAFDSTLRIAAAGTIWGLVAGPFNARQKGLTGLPQVLYVAKSTGSTGLRCGLFAGLYSTTHCTLQNYRMEKDWMNASIAGAVTGAVFAIKTHSWMGVLGMAALVSSITTAAEISTSACAPG